LKLFNPVRRAVARLFCQNDFERQYMALVRRVLEEGTWQENRTGVKTISVAGAAMRFDLKKHGFPAVTTKKLAVRYFQGELWGFVNAFRSAAQFREFGCPVWDQNANENEEWLANPYREGEDDVGAVYGFQWRQWPAYKLIDVANEAQIADAIKRGFRQVAVVVDEGVSKALLYKAVDQLRECLDTIIKNPNSRRILFHGWNPADLDAMALPPCHLLYQFHPNPVTKEISLTMFVRSNDLGLGFPFNAASGASLLETVGRLTGYAPRFINYFIGDAHIYESHLDMLKEQLMRRPKRAPRLKISDRIPEFAKTGIYEPEWLEKIRPSDFELEGYRHHPAIKAPMAV
jgi:thymidylate synthase